ncbi:MAG: alpha/beta fold hydrolase [Bacteroidota bacterium]|nr:alpha/beta fold hydrolase [Bacteroidota bacterium]MDX5430097.1 alpha/beta fold hydrolase [Bacteroidota bacterium]MDX5468861.1 alpha/beta fold hydrolase [Bacteroidota bacterium]
MKDVFMLHGALGARTDFDALSDLLKNDFRLHTLDFYGHGAASFSDDFGMKAFADQVREYLTQNALKQPLVFGYSMGGYVALYLESQYPGSFESIMTLGTKFNWNPEGSQREAAMLNPEKILEKVPKYAAVLEATHGEKWKQLCEETAKMMLALGDQPLFTESDAAALNLPVRLGLGDSDKMVSLEETSKMFRALSTGTLSVLPGTPHPIGQVNPVLLASELKHFWQG